MQKDELGLLEEAVKLHKEAKYQEAEELYKEILQINPENDSAWYFMSFVARQLVKNEAAVEYLKNAISVYPSPDYYKELIDVLFALNRKEAIISVYEELLNVTPEDLDSHFKLGIFYQELNRVDKALECFNNVIKLNPNIPEAHNAIGTLYTRIDDAPKAYYHFKKAVDLKPDYGVAHYNLGFVLYCINEFDRAISEYEKALELNYNVPEVHCNLGAVYQKRGMYDQSFSCYRQGLEVFPDDAGLRFNLGGMLVKKGNFEEGWQYFESRLDFFPHHKLMFPPDIKPKWDSTKPIEGKTIYVYPTSYEFGYGDSIIFARYLPLLKSMGAKVICKTQPGLEKFFRENDLGAEILDNSTPEQELKFDYQLPYLSMPYAFKANPDNIPSKEGYLKADPQKVEYYKEKFFNNNKFKLGIFWFSHASDPDRTMCIEDFRPFFDIEGVKVYSIQKGPGIEQLDNIQSDIVNLGATFNDFSDTAAAVENLDLVICPDTSIAHLTGAIGKPVWVFLSTMADCKWLLETEYTIWYKNMRLFRQKNLDSWDYPIEKALEMLKETTA
jgi:tetratricopeptide (TPR) repeat protein